MVIVKSYFTRGSKIRLHASVYLISSPLRKVNGFQCVKLFPQSAPS